jgi:protein-S-isoprenylcysteine O-methyltransferase Ste14
MELKVPPLLVMLIAAALIYGLSMLFELTLFSTVVLLPLSGITFCCGLLFLFGGVLQFRSQKTTLNPLKPDASTLVTSGIYRVTRNPMYVGMLLLLLAWAIYLNKLAAFVILPLFVFYLTRYQIIPEEAFLKNKFGGDYEQFMQRTRRWL